MFNKYSEFIDQCLGLSSVKGLKGIEMLRNNLFASIVKVVLPLGLLIDAYNVYMAFQNNLYGIAIIDMLVYGLILIMVLVPFLRIETKRIAFMLLIYFLAIVLLIMVDNKAPGLLWLIGISIMATGIISYRYGYMTLLTNILILLALGLLQAITKINIVGIEEGAVAFWLVIISNFVLVNILTIFSIDKLLRGLENNLTYMELVQADMKDKDQQLQAMYSAINEAVIITDTRDVILNMNYKAVDLTGYNLEESIGKSIGDVYQVKHLGQKVEIGQKFFIKAILFSKSGKEYSIQESVTGVKAGGDINGSKVIVFRDMTDYNRIENELLQMHKMQAVGQLAGGIAHDFNNMLGGILGYSELIELQHIDNDHVKKYNATIMDTAKRASELTSQLLTFSRQNSIEMRMVNLHETIMNSIQLLDRTINPLIVIKTDFESSNIFVNGDKAQLQNALLNLGINARDAMPDGGEFTLKTELMNIGPKESYVSKYNIEPGEYVRITVSDQGIGIPKEYIGRVFEPFFTTKPIGKGTGLGLSAVYGTIQSHQGFICVSSEIGFGTEFELYLPVVQAEDKVKVYHTEVDELILDHNKKVLVIDDEAGIRDSIQSMLEFLGYQVITAHNGEEGIRLYHEYHETLSFIVLDIIMPVKNGIDTLKSIRSDNMGIPIIMITGFVEPRLLKLISTYNISGILNKPFTMKALTDIIKDTIK